MDCNIILGDMKNEIESYIKSSREPCKSDVSQVMRGIHGHTSISNRPFIGLAIESDDIDQGTFDVIGSDNIRKVKVLLYCYMEPAHLGNYDDMYQMVADLKYFFKYNFSSAPNTSVGRFAPIEAGIDSSVTYFDMKISVIYQENI